jgi:hypothetical protein
MLVYPQLTQFPVARRRRVRTAVNRARDGSSVKLADPPGGVTEWNLSYSDLSDDEAAALQQFFESAEGTLNEFTFLDPNDNLLAHSDDLLHAGWEHGPLLTLTNGAADPCGGTGAWHVENSGAAAQEFAQTLSAPAGYLYCMSVYVRADVPATATMVIGDHRADRTVTEQWTRIAFTDSGDPDAESIRFALEFPAGAAVDVYGMQVEPQAAPSGYRPSSSGGVYENARLRDDTLTITTTGVNRHSCTVNIIHADHL